MKKFTLILAVLAVLFIGLFVWALSGAGPANAPTDVQTIDVTPSS